MNSPETRRVLYLKPIPPVAASGHKPSYYLGLSEESLAVPVSLLPGQESYNLDVLLELLISASDEARVTSSTESKSAR